MVQRGSIGLDVRIERKLFSAAHDGNAMVAHGAGNQDLVTWFAESTGKVHPFGDEADTTGVDEHAIAVAAINHLGIARNNMDTSFFGHFGHAFADAFQIGNGKAFFQNEPTAEVLGDSATGGNIVYRAAHSQPANVSAGEKAGSHHKTVGGIGNTLTGSWRWERRRIVAFQQLFVCVCLEKYLVDNALHHSAAATMTQQYRFVHLVSFVHAALNRALRSSRKRTPSMRRSKGLDKVTRGCHVKTPCFDALGADDKVSDILNLARLTLEDDYLKAVVLIDMHMHGSYHHVQIGVLDMVQFFLQVVGVVVVHDSERTHNDSPRHGTLIFHQRFAH